MGSVGPGLVYVLAVLGAGDIVSNSTAGAGYRYSLIWVLGITMVFRFVWVNTSAKYVLVTGEKPADGIRSVRPLGSLGDSDLAGPDPTFWQSVADAPDRQLGPTPAAASNPMGSRHLVLCLYLCRFCHDVLGRVSDH